MKAIFSHRKLFILVLVGVICIFAAGLLAVSAEDLLREARQQYANHNYNQALALLGKALAAGPEAATLRGAQRLKALSMCRLRDEDGYAYGKKIMAEHPAFEKDAELWRAMGDDNLSRGERKVAYECFIKAAELYEKAKDHTPAADAYLKAVECLRHHHGITAAQQEAKSWSQRRRAGTDEVLRICDHVVTLKIDDARKAKALRLAGWSANREGSWEYAQKAIERYRRAAEDFAKTPSAAPAQLEIGRIYERFSRYIDAVKAYAKVIQNFDDAEIAKQAKRAIDEIKAPRVTVYITKPYLPGEKAVLGWEVRNVRRVKLEAYRVDLPAALAGIKDDPKSLSGKLFLARIVAEEKARPVESWDFIMPDEGGHQYHRHVLDSPDKQTTVPIAIPLDKAGAYIVRARGVNPDNKSSESWALAVFSKIAAIAKADADQA
ncbi:MAG: hypothetical protein KAU28_10085, partial [Phycisphaerae bacterium]|nr:hypothetical protein [Phycisphaerae bacterium]